MFKKLSDIMFRDQAGKISSRKIIAIIFVLLAMIEKAKLVFWTRWHFVVALRDHGVSDAVTIALITSLDGIAVLCLTVYGVRKAGDSAPTEPTP